MQEYDGEKAAPGFAPYNPTPMPMFMVFVPLTIPDDRIA
jgi:hypothetical protein